MRLKRRWQCRADAAEYAVQGRGQVLGLGVLDFVREERFLYRVAVLGVEDPGPLLNMVQRFRGFGEHDDLVGGFQWQQCHATRSAHANIVALGYEHRRQLFGEGARREEIRLQDEALLPLEQGLVQDFQHVDRTRNDVCAALQKEDVAIRFLVDFAYPGP